MHRLPEMHPRLGSEIKLVPGLDVHGLIPGIDIAHRPVDAEFRRAVRIGKQALARGLLVGLVAPDLAVAQEQPLIAGKPVENRRLLAVEREVIGGLGDGQARKVGDVLAQRQLAVDEHALDRAVAIVLVDELGRARIEILAVVRRPPILQHALGVVFAALIVEAVADLMADHRADAAIIHGVVGIGIEEGRLQNRRRKDDLVQRGIVIGVHGLRRHAPFAAVDRLIEPHQLAIPFEFRAALGIAEKIVGLTSNLE